VTLTVDSGATGAQVYSATFALSGGNNAHVARLPMQMSGYTAQLTISTTTDSDATQPLMLDSVVVTGDIKHGLVPTQTTEIVNQTLNGQTLFPRV
jgi:hypothetical protein